MTKSDLTIVIGNKNLSSWSMRPWLALKQTNVPFREEMVVLDQPETRAQLADLPSHKVPVLRDGDLVLWESLAICEYLAEKFPGSRLWPEDQKVRGVARSVSHEMHAGFYTLRMEHCMNIVARTPKKPSEKAAKDIARIQTIITQCRERYGGQGPFLFGHWSIADCMYAPVLTRFRTYAIELDPVAQRYSDAVFAFPAVQDWCTGAADEIP